MEITEFLNQNGIIVKTSAKKLTAMFAQYNTTSDFEKSFKHIEAAREGDALTAKQLLLFIKDKTSDLKQIDPQLDSLDNAIRGVIISVIEQKQNYVEMKKDERVENTKVPDYYFNGKYADVEVEIFQTVDKAENEHDKKLYSCFCKAGNYIVFASNEITKLIMQNNDGSLALGNDMTSMSEGALWSGLCRAMKAEFQAYRDILKQELAMIDNNDLDIEKNANIIENIFLTKVPCSFSKVVTVVKRYKKNDDGTPFFDGFRIKPNKRMLNSFDFDGFISVLSKNFIDMTRGCLKEQREYKAFSNRDDEAAVTHWKLPREEVWKKAEMPPKWKDFFHGKASPRILQRVFWYIGAMQDAKNRADQVLVISASGMTGKSTLLEMLYRIFPSDFFGAITNATLDDKKDFALSERKVYEHHCLILDEYDGMAINGSRFKQIIGSHTPVSMSVKNKQSIEYDFTGTKMIFLSNEMSVLKDMHYRRRVIPVSFRKNCVRGMTAYTDADKEELVAQGRDFLNFCFRVYKECKLTKPNGEYFVLSPEQEEKFLNGEDIDEDENVISKKAFSADEEICEYFDIRDYEESETNIEFTNFIIDKFEKTGNLEDFMLARDIIDYIEDLANKKNSQDLNDLQMMFGPALQLSNGLWRVEHRNKIWWQFTQAMKDYGFVEKNKKFGKYTHKVWLGIKKQKSALSSQQERR